MSEWDNECMGWWVNDRVSEWEVQWMRGWVNEGIMRGWVNEKMSECEDEWMNEWTRLPSCLCPAALSEVSPSLPCCCAQTTWLDSEKRAPPAEWQSTHLCHWKKENAPTNDLYNHALWPNSQGSPKRLQMKWRFKMKLYTVLLDPDWQLEVPMLHLSSYEQIWKLEVL